MKIAIEFLTLLLLTKLSDSTKFSSPFDLVTPGPETELAPEYQDAIYSPTYQINQPEVRSQQLLFPVPEKDVGLVYPFMETDGQHDFLRLLKYMIPIPSAPIKPARADMLGGVEGLGGPMGPMSPGMLNTKYGNIIISGPMDVSERVKENSDMSYKILHKQEYEKNGK